MQRHIHTTSRVGTVIEDNHISYFPAANDVWGKVMFLHPCVIVFTGVGLASHMHHGSQSHDQGGLHPGGICIQGGRCLHPGGICIQGGRCLHPGGVCIHGGGSASRRGWEDPPPEHYKIQSIRERYAFCWSAFLFGITFTEPDCYDFLN